MVKSERRVSLERGVPLGGASGGDTAAGGREHSRNLPHEGQPHRFMCSHRLLSQPGQGRLCRASGPQTHPGMQDFGGVENHAWMRINGSFPTPLVFVTDSCLAFSD